MTTQNKALRFSMFALLYFTQGTILGYFASVNALYLLGSGFNMTNVGIFSTIAMIPFIIKILFGMLSDRFNLFGLGHRKPYIFIGLLVQAVCLVIVAQINPAQHYWGFVLLAFLVQMGMAFYDTCTDGLALDITPQKEQGMLQGFMVGGRSVGVIVAATACGFISQFLNWPAVFYFLALLTLIPIPLLFFIKDTGRGSGIRFNWAAFKAFKNVQVLAAAAVGLVVFLVIVGANQLMNPAFTARFGIDLKTAGLLTTVWGLGCVLGAMVGGVVKDKLGDKIALWISLALVVPAMLLLGFVGWQPLIWAVAVFFGIAYGLSQSVYFALAMKYTEASIAASMFAILMSVTNIGQAVGLGVGGNLANKLDYPITFVLFGAVMFLILPFFPLLFRKKSA